MASASKSRSVRSVRWSSYCFVTMSRCSRSTLNLLRSARCVALRSRTMSAGSGSANGSRGSFGASAVRPAAVSPRGNFVATRSTNSTPASWTYSSAHSKLCIAPLASAASARSTTSVQKPTELDGTGLPLNESSNDLEVALELPVGDGVEPLAPFPLAGGGEVIDEVVAEPVPGDFGGMEDARRLDEGARHAHDILAADIIAADGLVRELELARA